MCLTLFPRKKERTAFEYVSLSRRTTMWLVEEKSNNLLRQLKEMAKKCLYFSTALDGSSDARDTAHLLAFVRRLNEKFEVVDELLSMEALKSTTTGEKLHRRLSATLIHYGLSWN